MPKETETMPTWLAQHWAAETAKTEPIKPGDVIVKHNDSRHVTVTLVDDDIKNGCPGFEGKRDDGSLTWGYLYNISRVVSRA